MGAKHSSSAERTPSNLNAAERRFWWQAFVAAEVPTLLRSKGARISPIGAAHLAADYADAALAEFRRRFGRV